MSAPKQPAVTAAAVSVDQHQQELPPPPQQVNLHVGFDPHSGQNWLFPVDFVTPSYLPLICEKTLYHNSLVILPNRFEVSFVAAVVMHNIYRWYPLGKVVFMCSKRKAIQDQRTACDRLMKFVSSDVVDMALKPQERVRNWITKRAIFITSHTMATELTRQDADQIGMKKIKLLVIEDPQSDVRAHTSIIQKLTEMGAYFRVLCLTTTHGKTVEPAQLKQWQISNIELQWGNPQEKPEEWLMNKKVISNISSPAGGILVGLLTELQLLTQRYIINLHACKQIANTPFEAITAEHIQQERTRYEQSILNGVMRKNHFEIMRSFHMAEKLVQAHRILRREGVIALMDYFQVRSDALVQADSELMGFLHKIRQGVYSAPHPKFVTLENFLKEFFQQHRTSSVRILIVVEHTSNALLVNGLLKIIPESKHRCLIDDNYVHYVEQFRNGEVNVLVVTVEVEPTIDVGNTDLVVLFNITDRPLEFLAHIARTRGAQPGAIVMITTEGSEEAEITEILKNQRMYYYENRDILPIGVDLSDSMVRASPSLLPPGFQPKGRHVMFNRQTVIENGGTASAHSPSTLPGTVPEKRRVLEVLSDAPPTYDAINGCTYYQVMQVPNQPMVMRNEKQQPGQANGDEREAGADALARGASSSAGQ